VINIRKILIYNSGGGLGDSIQLFPLLLSLKKYFKSSTFYYLGSHQNHFEKKLKNYNIQLKTVNLDLEYFGFRWWHFFSVKKKIVNKGIEKFDLIIDLQSKIRNTIILKQIPAKYFFSSTFNFFFCDGKKNYLKKSRSISVTMLANLEIFLDNPLEIIEYSTKNISKRYHDEAKRLLPDNNYIGFSVTQGNEYRRKGWHIDKFINLAKKCISDGKRIVFFVEKSEAVLINHIKTELPDSLFPEHRSEIACPALVTTLASRLEGAITIDNGVMHMIGLTKIPMIVLFGPTNSKKFAPDGSNIEIIDSKVIYKSEDINKITVQDVLKKINF